MVYKNKKKKKKKPKNLHEDTNKKLLRKEKTGDELLWKKREI